jgi:hypothetical protein
VLYRSICIKYIHIKLDSLTNKDDKTYIDLNVIVFVLCWCGVRCLTLKKCMNSDLVPSAGTYDARSNRKTKKSNADEPQKLCYSSGSIQFYG